MNPTLTIMWIGREVLRHVENRLVDMGVRMTLRPATDDVTPAWRVIETGWIDADEIAHQTIDDALDRLRLIAEELAMRVAFFAYCADVLPADGVVSGDWMRVMDPRAGVALLALRTCGQLKFQMMVGGMSASDTGHFYPVGDIREVA